MFGLVLLMRWILLVGPSSNLRHIFTTLGLDRENQEMTRQSFVLLIWWYTFDLFLGLRICIYIHIYYIYVFKLWTCIYIVNTHIAYTSLDICRIMHIYMQMFVLSIYLWLYHDNSWYSFIHSSIYIYDIYIYIYIYIYEWYMQICMQDLSQGRSRAARWWSAPSGAGSQHGADPSAEPSARGTGGLP